MAYNKERNENFEHCHIFLQWCEKNGIIINPKVKVSQSTSHRYGLIALEDIKSNEVLVEIPRKMTLTASRCSIAERIKEFQGLNKEKLEDTSGWIPLLIALMYEMKSNNSFWSPYLNMCPRREEFNQPMFWEEEERHKELAGLSILWDVQRDLFNIEKEYKQFLLPFIEKNKDVMSEESYPLELFLHMVGFIMSYSFTDGENDETLMVPVADILNHHSNNNAHLLFDDENALKMISIKPINKDKEIFNTFGKLGNSQLLYKYGFVEKGQNAYDTVEIPLVLIVDVLEATDATKLPVLQAMLAYMKKMGIADEEEPLVFCSSGLKPGPDIYAVLRILHMEVKEFIGLLQDHVSWYQDSYFLFLLEHVQEATKKQSCDGEIPRIDISDDDDDDEILVEGVKVAKNHEELIKAGSCVSGNLGKSEVAECTVEVDSASKVPEQTFVPANDQTKAEIIATANSTDIDTLRTTSTCDLNCSNENTVSGDIKDVKSAESKKQSSSPSDGQKKSKTRKRKQKKQKDYVEDSEEDMAMSFQKNQQAKIQKKGEEGIMKDYKHVDPLVDGESKKLVEAKKEIFLPLLEEEKDKMLKVSSKEEYHSEDPDDESDDEDSEAHLQLSYDQINSILPPSWKKTMQCVVTNAMAAMTSDTMEADEPMTTEHAALAYHVRSAQEKILKLLEKSVTI